MAFDDRTQASFEAASEAVKQLLTLSVGSIGAAIALFDDADKTGIDFGTDGGCIKIGLALLGLSVAAGLFALGAIAGQLGSNAIDKPSTYAPAVRWLHLIQLTAFGVGLLVLVVVATA